MTRSSSTSGAEGTRAFSLYGVNRHDRVAACAHFDAATLDDAVERARAQVGRFPKVELWVACDCVWVAVHPKDPGRWRSLLPWMQSAKRREANPFRDPVRG